MFLAKEPSLYEGVLKSSRPDKENNSDIAQIFGCLSGQESVLFICLLAQYGKARDLRTISDNNSFVRYIA